MSTYMCLLMYLYVCIKDNASNIQENRRRKTERDWKKGREIGCEGEKEVEKSEESKEEEQGGRITRKGNKERKIQTSLLSTVNSSHSEAIYLPEILRVLLDLASVCLATEGSSEPALSLRPHSETMTGARQRGCGKGRQAGMGLMEGWVCQSHPGNPGNFPAPALPPEAAQGTL